MALDFCQVDNFGRVNGCTVRLTPELHLSSIHPLSRDQFPLLMRMNDYYCDVVYSRDELPGLAKEIQVCREGSISTEARMIFDQMFELVVLSIRDGFSIEAIAD
jgi:hypothetical protein